MEMVEKNVVIVILLALGVLGLVGYVALKAHQSLEYEGQEGGKAPPPPEPSLAGKVYYERGEYAKALDAFNKALAEGPENQRLKDYVAATDAMLRIQNAVTSKKWDEALAACEEAAKSPLSATGAKRRMEEILDLKTYYENYDKGCQAAQEKDYAKASQAFTDAFQIAQRYDLPTDASQKAEEAQSFLRKADLKSYYEYYEQGTQAVLQKDYEKAARAFSQAFQIAQKIGLPSDACEKAKLLQSPERAAEFNAYQENYSKGVQAAEQKDYAKAAQAFQEAVRIAQSLGLFTDASDKAQKMLPLAEKLSAALSDLDCVMRMCAERNDPYAIYAAATYYLSSDEYAVRYQDLKAKLEAARTTVASHREMFPSLRSTKTLQITVLTMRNGQVVKGKVLERNGKFIRFHQETDGKSSTRMIMAGDVADIKEEVIKPEEANNKLAAELLTQALSQMDSRHPVKALSKIGQIECELSDVPLMKNVEEQKRILASVSAASGAKGRANLQSFVAACVERCQSMCSKCDGLGRMPCPTCRGLGKMELNCGSCGGTGTAPCPDCAGRGKTNDGRTRCPHCAGKGVLKCIRCAGKGKISQPCLNCAGGTVPCDACLGTGQRPATPR